MMTERVKRAVFALLAVMLFVSPAGALYQYKTKQPYWKVGKYDRMLSRACIYSRFNITEHKTIVSYQGKRGEGLTSVGLKNWNLYDPEGMAEDGKAYHFWHSGYSDCKVYVEVLTRRQQRSLRR